MRERQLNFDYLLSGPPPAPPLSPEEYLAPRTRTDDPPSSKRAEAELKHSGRIRGQWKLCLDLIAQYPGRSTKELAELGTLDRVKSLLKTLGMVNSTPDYKDQPRVINGASDLLVEIFGDNGRHARSAVGMASLPFGIPVEIEMIVEVE